MLYSEIEKLPPEAYLDPERFRTAFDAFPENVATRCADRQHAHGLDVSRLAKTVHIATRGTWSAEMLDGSSLSACEGIGYHACTADLLRGFLDGPAELVVHRYSEEAGLTRTVVKKEGLR